MIKIIDKQFDKKVFNSKATHPLQTWEWGEAKEKLGNKVLRFCEIKDNKILSTYQMTIHTLPFGYKIGYIPRSILPSKSLIQFLKKYSKKNKIIFIKLEPYIFNSKSNWFDLVKKEGVVRSSHPLFPNWTQTIDLTKSEDELLKNMKSKTRYNIRLAERKGVVVKEDNSLAGFNIFKKLYFETCRRQNYKGHNDYYHKIIWEEMKKAKISHILIAYYKKTPLAAYHLFSFKDTLYYPYGGSSSKLRNLMATNLIMWRSILLGKKLKNKVFDLWGSLPPNYNDINSWSGFTRFKKGYGTQFKELIGSFDIVVNPVQYYLFYNPTYKIRQKLLNLR